MAYTTQYIGSRYVPLFAEPAEWDSTRTYEPLTIVMHDGNSYTSRQYVPVGIKITNDKFWALTGNYNAQVEQYRQEVKTEKTRAETAEQTLQANIDTEKTRAETAEQTLQANIDTKVTYFQSVAEMKADDNLQIGDICRTISYTSNGIGGGVYIITNDSANDMDKIELDNGKTAVLMCDEVTLESLGYTDGDCSKYLKRATEIGVCKLLDNTTYKLNKQIAVDNLYMVGHGTLKAEITDKEEFDIKVNGSVDIEGISFVKTSPNKLFGFYNSTGQISNCKFNTVSNNNGGFIDLYKNNRNFKVNNCDFDLTSTIGGFWIRGGIEESDISNNITIENCHFTHNTDDECLAIWGWKGTLENVIIDKCSFDIKKGSFGITIASEGSGVTKNVKLTNNTIKSENITNFNIRNLAANTLIDNLTLDSNCNCIAGSNTIVSNSLLNISETVNLGSAFFKNCIINFTKQFTAAFLNIENTHIYCGDETSDNNVTRSCHIVNSTIDNLKANMLCNALADGDLVYINGLFLSNATLLNISCNANKNNTYYINNAVLPKRIYIGPNSKAIVSNCICKEEVVNQRANITAINNTPNIEYE